MSERPLPEETTLPEHAGALLCLELFADEPARGPAPSDEELALLCDGTLLGKLGHTRYQEVLSHLNTDSALMARWLSVSETGLAELKPESNSRRLAKWINKILDVRLAGAIATAGVLAVALFLARADKEDPGILPSAPHQPPSYAGIGDRNLDASMSRGALAALAQLPEEQQKILLDGLQPPPPATDAEALHPLAFQYGELLTRARLECTLHPILGDDLVRQIRDLQSALGMPVETDCASLSRQWESAIR